MHIVRSMPERPKRVRLKRPRLRDFMRAALRNADMTQADLIRELPAYMDRGTIGPLFRGETVGIKPEVVNEVAKRLGVRVEAILEASGFDIVLTPQKQVPDDLAEAWAALSPEERQGLRLVVRAAARGAAGRDEPAA